MPVELEGAVQLRVALKRFAPDLSKETQSQMAAALKTVTTVARGYVPNDGQVLSGWSKTSSGADNLVYRPFPKFNSMQAKAGITYSTSPSKPNKNGFVALARIINKSAGGAIYETAGRKSGITGKFTPNLGGDLVGTTQKLRGRAMFRTWQEDQGRAKGAILKAIFKSKEEFDIKVKAHSNG